MHEEKDTFTSLCERIRFSLDERDERPAEHGHRVADFVAQVRASSLQVTHSTVPSVATTIDRVSESLGLCTAPEVYAVNNPTMNAFAPAFAGRHRPIIVVHSGLITTLDSNELAFVVGHELGHLGLQHGNWLHQDNTESEFEALQSRSRQRYAEVSADRVGLVAVRSMYVAARVMIKLASGLTSKMLGVNVDAFVKQIERDPKEMSRAWELEDSHPALPFRLWALLRFAQSTDYDALVGQAHHGIELTEIDRQIVSRIAKLGDGRLSELESHIYEMALVWAGAAMVVDDNVIETKERETLVRLVGKEHANKAIRFAESQGRNAVLEKFSSTLQRVNNGSLATRRKLEESMKAFAIALDQDLNETQAGQMAARCLRLH